MDNKIVLYPVVASPHFKTDIISDYLPLIRNNHVDWALISIWNAPLRSTSGHKVFKATTDRIDNIFDVLKKEVGYRASKIELININDKSTFIYHNLARQIKASLDYANCDKKIKQLVMSHGHTDRTLIDYRRKYWDQYQKYKNGEKELSDNAITPKAFCIEFITSFLVIEWCIANDVVVKHIWLDPLQIKFEHFYPKLKIHNWYFHTTKGNKLIQNDTRSKKSTTTAFKFDISTISMYRFKDALRSLIDSNSQPKMLSSVFGMYVTFDENSFRAKFAKTINAMSSKAMLIENNIYYCYDAKLLKRRPKYTLEKIHGIPNASKLPMLEYDEYLSRISKSLSTIIIPSLHENSFSLIRFVESIANGCIPILLGDCNYVDGFHEDKELIALYEANGLIISESVVSKNSYDITELLLDRINHIEKNYEHILSRILRTSLFDRLMSEEYYTKHARIMLG